MKKRGWFEDWFDTEYYHILYNKRDDREAESFLHKLVEVLNLAAGQKVADIACGKGRHSRVLAGMGFEVHGFDLSVNSINYARKHASVSEVFEVQDIRQPYSSFNFNAAFNLFTSFGYFETRQEDLDALQNIYDMLMPGGFFIQDYLNGPPVIKNLPCKSVESHKGLDFNIVKAWNSPFVVKNIDVIAKDGIHHFMEKVKLFESDELLNMHRQCGFETQQVFGDYSLGEYEANSSPRLIIVSKKPV